MNNKLRCLSALTLLMLGTYSFAQDRVLQTLNAIKAEQTRIDQIDGSLDQNVGLKSYLQSYQASETYFTSVNTITERVMYDELATDAQKVERLIRIQNILKRVNGRNVHFYTQFSNIFDLIIKVQKVDEAGRLEAILKSNVHSALNLIAFYIDKSVAEQFLKATAYSEPAELLKHYKEFAHKDYAQSIIDHTVRVAPMKIKTYLHSWNDIHRVVKASGDPVTQKVVEIYEQLGTASRSFVLLHDIYSGRISIENAHQAARFDSTFFSYLITMRSNTDMLGEHSVDEALMYQCLKKVRIINDLHEESDAKRFRSLRNLSSEEIYTLMVYSEDEIYTSTFLGMYNRMKSKMVSSSTYEFLQLQNFNKFRTFIKMCAGYNTLSGFIGSMTTYEKQQLFQRFVEGLEKENDNLQSAVAIADTYGTLRSRETKELFEQSIMNYYHQIKDVNLEAEKLYSLLLSVFELGGSNMNMYSDASELKVLSIDRIFKDGKNVQQHFFFDDPDGKASYAHFKNQFTHSNWQIIDRGTYILIKSRSGKDVEIYANKPTTEYAGQDAIKAHFEETQRWPDIVVHRGHSYFVSAAIESLTPNAEIVFLGSCGGYNNIANVLNYSPNAQIISSKQIGTMMVNDKLCFELNETIRKGQDIVWDDLWYRLDKKFASGSTASSRFKDYIPPHKNLGALLIKTYRRIL